MIFIKELDLWYIKFCLGMTKSGVVAYTDSFRNFCNGKANDCSNCELIEQKTFMNYGEKLLIKSGTFLYLGEEQNDV